MYSSICFLVIVIVLVFVFVTCMGIADKKDDEFKILINKYNDLVKKHNDLVKINQVLLNDNILMAIELEQNRSKKTKKSKSSHK